MWTIQPKQDKNITKNDYRKWDNNSNISKRHKKNSPTNKQFSGAQMKTLFALLGCPFCNTASLAIAAANCNLSVKDQVKIIEVLPNEINHKAFGDPRMSFLAALNKSESLQEWGFPILVLDNTGMRSKWNNVDFGTTGRVMIHSAYSHKHYQRFIESM